MRAEDDFNLLSADRSKDYDISNEEIDAACSDIDLDSQHDTKDDLDGLEGLTSNNIDLADNDACSFEYNADVVSETDDKSCDSTYGIALDSDIVNSVLDGSDDRRRSRKNEKFKKYCKYSMIVFLGFAGILAILNSDLLARVNIQQHGTAFYMNDEDKFLDAQAYNIFDVPVEVSHENFQVPTSYEHFIDVRGPAYHRETETPLFVGFKDGSTVIEDVLSDCLGLTIAGTKPVPKSAEGELHTYISEENGRAYVNVDLSNTDGLRQARKAGLESSSLADAVFSPQLQGIGNIVFHDGYKARLFTLLRHPVDLAVNEYYIFTRTAAEEVLRKMTLEEFISSKYYVGNHMTKFVGGCSSPESVNDTCLQWSKEFFRTKYIIGLQDDIYGAITLYEDYFFWDNTSPAVKVCKRHAIKSELDRDYAIYKQAGQKIDKQSTLYQNIVEQNTLDMELYWYAVELQHYQRAWIPSLAANR